MEPEDTSDSSGGHLHFTPIRPGTRTGPARDTHKGSRSMTASNRTMVLAIILACYLMIIVDISVIITALPDIHRALDFSSTALSWVQNAYALTFGGLLLLGARAGDILGRRRVFMAGIALFTASSLLAGLAQSPSWLLAARAAQGVGAAIAAPSTLALLTITFREGIERTRAVAWYSAVAGGGASLGLVLGGVLTQWVSWRSGLFINVPIGLALIWLAPRYLPETEREPGRFDLAGAAFSTLGMTAVVYGFVRAAADGWGDRLRRPHPRRERDVRDVLLPHSVLPGRQRLRAPRGRRRVPADDPSGVHDGAGGAADRTAGGQHAPPHRRLAARLRGHGMAQPDRRRHTVFPPNRPPAPAAGHRNGRRPDAAHVRGDRRRGAGGRRRCVGRGQHRAPARRRAGYQRPCHGLHGGGRRAERPPAGGRRGKRARRVGRISGGGAARRRRGDRAAGSLARRRGGRSPWVT